MKSWQRRLIGALAGAAYAIVLGIILIMMTGGGHGNVTYLMFFLLTSLLGLLYPVMGFIVSDIRSILSKSGFVAVFVVHAFLVFMFFDEGILEANVSPRDFTISEHPIISSVLVSLLTLPQISCLVFFVAHLVRGAEVAAKERRFL